MRKNEIKPRGYWNKERVLEVIKKCKTRNEFCKKYGGAYSWAKTNGCYEEMIVLIEAKWQEKWTAKEACAAEVMKWTSFKEFRKNMRQCYHSINEHGWADELFAHFLDKGKYKKNRKPLGYWTKEKCIERAKLYSSSKELKKADRGCHHTILDNGWEDVCFAHMKYRRHRTSCFTKEHLNAIAKKYATFPELRKGDTAAFDAMQRNGWVEELCQHMLPEKEEIPLTFETCAEAASKYTCRSDFQNSIIDRRYYSYARHHGFLDDICSHMQTRHTRKTRCIYAAEFSDNCAYIGLTYNHERRWAAHLHDEDSAIYRHIQITGLQPSFNIVHDYVKALEAQVLEGVYVEKFRNEGWTILNTAKTGSLGTSKSYTKKEVLERAKKYSSLTEFRKNDGGYYESGYRSGYWKEVIAIYETTYVHHWTDDEIREAALQCKTRIEFQKRFKPQYQAAQTKGELDRYCGHMKELVHKWTDDELREAANQCKTRSEFQRRFPRQYNNLIYHKRLDEFCGHMINKATINSFKRKG